MDRETDTVDPDGIVNVCNFKSNPLFLFCVQLVFPGNPAEGSSVPLEQGTQQFKVSESDREAEQAPLSVRQNRPIDVFEPHCVKPVQLNDAFITL